MGQVEGVEVEVQHAVADPLGVLADLPDHRVGVPVATSYADLELDRAGLVRRTALTVESFVLVPSLLRGTHMITMLQRRLLGALDVADLQTTRPPLGWPRCASTCTGIRASPVTPRTSGCATGCRASRCRSAADEQATFWYTYAKCAGSVS